MALIQTLQDDFEFGGIDSGKWTATNGQVVVGTDLNLKLSSIAGGNYVSLNSTTTYSLISSSIFIQVTDVGDQSITSWELYPLYLVADSNNKIFIRIAEGNVSAIKVVDGVTSNVGSGVVYDSSTMRWFRIRESGGTIFFDYASDPSGTWTNITSGANPITLTALTVEVLIGTWQAESTTTTAKLDNLNVIPDSLQFDWKGYTWNKRIHQSNVAGQTWSSSNISAPDPNGYLTLQLTNAGSAPIGAEIFSDQRGFGYGTYTVVVGTRLDNIGDPVAFGGLFTFDFTDSPAYKEIDVNEVRDYNSEPNKQILKNHAWDNSGREFITNNMDYPSDVVQTHVMKWESNKITFDSYIGAGTGGSNYFHSVHSTHLPTPGLERLHFNVFVDPTIVGYETATPLDVVIRDFSFDPINEGIGGRSSHASTMNVLNVMNVK